MSMSALLVAVRERLREELRLELSQCDIQPEGRPPAIVGEFFIGVDEAGVQSDEKTFLRETYSVAVVITRRTSGTPKDRQGNLYLRRFRSLEDLERKVIVAIHNSQRVRELANAEIGAPQENAGDAIIQPLWWTGRGRTRFEAGDWCGGAGDSPQAFMVRILNFQGGLRLQAMDIAK